MFKFFKVSKPVEIQIDHTKYKLRLLRRNLLMDIYGIRKQIILAGVRGFTSVKSSSYSYTETKMVERIETVQFLYYVNKYKLGDNFYVSANGQTFEVPNVIESSEPRIEIVHKLSGDKISDEMFESVKEVFDEMLSEVKGVY